MQHPDYVTKQTERRRLADSCYQRGITVEQYEELLLKQNSVCCICLDGPGLEKRLLIDHCHRTGVVRGLLCRRCNSGLGMFRDNAAFLQSAIRYLAQ